MSVQKPTKPVELNLEMMNVSDNEFEETLPEILEHPQYHANDNLLLDMASLKLSQIEQSRCDKLGL